MPTDLCIANPLHLIKACDGVSKIAGVLQLHLALGGKGGLARGEGVTFACAPFIQLVVIPFSQCAAVPFLWLQQRRDLLHVNQLLVDEVPRTEVR